MDQQIREIIFDLKSYLEYLKGMGITALPLSEMKPGIPPTPQVLTLEEN